MVRLGRLAVAAAAVAALAVAAAPGSAAHAWPAQPPTGPARAAIATPVAVFGSDDRVPVPAKYKDLQDKIGLLFNPRARSVCTAFCVARDIVATAGHCLHRTAGERVPRLADFWFARNYDVVRDFARIAGYGNGTATQRVMTGATGLRVRPPIDATSDWALLRLAKPVCAKGVLPIRVLAMDDILREAAAGRVFQVSYHRDFTPWKLAYSRPCTVSKRFEGADWATIEQDFSEPGTLILHTCDTAGASSGSPLLRETPAGPEVIGINVGTYVQSKVEMQGGQVTRRLKSDMVANTGVASAAFADKLEIFRDAVILSSPAQMRELQAALKARGLFAGRIDGTYGAELRRAIEAYEKAERLPATGLATEALLKRLGGGPAAAKAKAKS